MKLQLNKVMVFIFLKMKYYFLSLLPMHRNSMKLQLSAIQQTSLHRKKPCKCLNIGLLASRTVGKRFLLLKLSSLLFCKVAQKP